MLNAIQHFFFTVSNCWKLEQFLIANWNQSLLQMDLKLNGLVILKHHESESHKEAVKRLTEVPKQNRDVGDFCNMLVLYKIKFYFVS